MDVVIQSLKTENEMLHSELNSMNKYSKELRIELDKIKNSKQYLIENNKLKLENKQLKLKILNLENENKNLQEKSFLLKNDDQSENDQYEKIINNLCESLEIFMKSL